MKKRNNITKAIQNVGNRLSTAARCVFMISFFLIPSSCSLIDDDLSGCPTDSDSSYELNYELRLVTNMTTELQTQLTTTTDVNLSSALRTKLAEVFTDYAHDVDLSFYDTQGDSTRLHHDQHIMDANQASYTLHLPMRHYMHLAVANVTDNNMVSIATDEKCHKAMLRQVQRDTIDSHTTGLFTARQPMEVLGNVSQSFDVRLYMANCAAALVLDPKGHGTADQIRVYSTGFATGFNICDSTYQYSAQPPIVRTTPIAVKGEATRAFCSVTFPSPEIRKPAGETRRHGQTESGQTAGETRRHGQTESGQTAGETRRHGQTESGQTAGETRTIIETTEPFIAKAGEEALWEYRVYVPLPDGSITETILRIKEPLRAGQLKIIKCWLDEHGGVVTLNSEVSTSVTLDWKEGLEIES